MSAHICPRIPSKNPKPTKKSSCPSTIKQHHTFDLLLFIRPKIKKEEARGPQKYAANKYCPNFMKVFNHINVTIAAYTKLKVDELKVSWDDGACKVIHKEHH